MDQDFELDLTAQELLSDLVAALPRGKQPGDITVSDYMAATRATVSLSRAAATHRLEAFAAAGKIVELPGGIIHQGRHQRAWRRAEG